MRQIKSICVVLLLSGLASNLYGQTIPKRLHNVMEEIYPGNTPGAALLVLKDDQLLFKEGFGTANLKSGVHITPKTHFRMASVSKQFTAMSILWLQKHGLLVISDPAIQYLPSLPQFARNITIEQLMTHTSGIADYEPLIPKDRKEQVSDADVLRLISHSDSLYFTPGAHFRYSNTGFCLLTQIVEKVSGLTYPEFMRKNIFQPLNMPTTMIYQKGKKIPNRAYGYHFQNGQWTFADQSLTSATMGDGSVYTSLNEYRNWIKALWSIHNSFGKSDPLLPHTSISPNLNYGFGWFISKVKDGSTGYFHSGETTGFHNLVYHNPSQKIMIVLFSNCDDERIAKAFDKILNIMNVKIKAVPEGKTLFDFLSGIYGD